MPAMTGGTIGVGAIGGNVALDAGGWTALPGFLARVGQIIAVVALEVQAESTSVTNDTNRKQLATLVLRGPSASLTQAFAIAIVGDLSSNPTLDDQQLLTRVEAIWDAMAGTI